MKAISLWQPWASLWVSGRKVHETRHWTIDVPPGGFWLAVHATQRIEFDLPSELRKIVEDEFGGHWSVDLPRGALIGKVIVGACVGTDSNNWVDDEDFACGNWAAGRYGWRADTFAKLIAPVPYRGRQSMFQVPNELMADAGLFDGICARTKQPPWVAS